MGGVIPPPASGPPGVPPGRDPRRPWAPSPFMRLARAHAASVSGDALFAIGLAGSLLPLWMALGFRFFLIYPFEVALAKPLQPEEA